MDDADALGCALRDPAHAGKSDRVIAAQHDGQRPGRGHVCDAARDLIEALFQIRRNGKHVASVAQCHLLAQVDAKFIVIRGIQRRYPPDSLRPEPGARPIGRPRIKWDANHRRVVPRHVPHILDIRRLQERVDASEMRQFAARKGGDGAIGQALRPRQPHVERPFLFAPPAICRQPPLGIQRLPALHLAGVEVWMVEAAAHRRRHHACVASGTSEDHYHALSPATRDDSTAICCDAASGGGNRLRCVASRVTKPCLSGSLRPSGN